jgi:hypothetical protein
LPLRPRRTEPIVGASIDPAALPISAARMAAILTESTRFI